MNGNFPEAQRLGFTAVPGLILILSGEVRSSTTCGIALPHPKGFVIMVILCSLAIFFIGGTKDTLKIYLCEVIYTIFPPEIPSYCEQ